MKTLNKLCIAIILVILSTFLYAKDQKLNSYVINKLSRLNHTKMEALMHRIGKDVPKKFYNCLCSGRGGVGGSSYYGKNGCEATGVLGGHWTFAIPADAETWKSCISRVKYEDNSTVVDAITERFDPCWNAVVLNNRLNELKNKRLKLKDDRDLVMNSLKHAQKLLDDEYERAKLNSKVAQYWIELARKQKARILEARDECLVLKDIALRNAMSTFSSRFSQYLHEFKTRSKEEIARYVKPHRKKIMKYQKQHIDKIKSNNAAIVKNQEKIKQYKNKYNSELTQFTTKDKYKNWEKNIKRLKEDNKFLKYQNSVLSDTIDSMDDILIQPDKYINEDIQEILTKNEDALIGQWKSDMQNKSNAEEMERLRREVQNDHARRVAEQLFLGMDRAIIESMNPDKILAELDPVLKVKQMDNLARTYTQMAEGINDEMIKGVIVGRMPETQKYYQKVRNLNNKVMKYNQEIKQIEKTYLEGRNRYRRKLRKCEKMTQSGDSPGYEIMQKRWEYRMSTKKKRKERK